MAGRTVGDLDPQEDTRAELSRYFGLTEAEISRQIEEHKYFINLTVPNEIPLEEAFESWSRQVFLPLISAIGELGLEQDFPDLGKDELFIRVSSHWYDLKRNVDPGTPARNAVLSFGAAFALNDLSRADYYQKQLHL